MAALFSEAVRVRGAFQTAVALNSLHQRLVMVLDSVDAQWILWFLMKVDIKHSVLVSEAQPIRVA
jgi:hypothetical protein